MVWEIRFRQCRTFVNQKIFHARQPRWRALGREGKGEGKGGGKGGGGGEGKGKGRGVGDFLMKKIRQ